MHSFSSLSQARRRLNMADTLIPHAFILFMLALLFSSHLPFFPTVEASTAGNGGFKVELIRRDSPKSPFYSSATARAKAVVAAVSTRSTITPENGQYLMKLSVGTPPRDIFVILDSGSDLFWAQCSPCASCYKQIAPVYDPSRSSTFRELPCRSEQCRWLFGSCSMAETCKYSYGYGSGLTEGNLASETVAIASKSGERVSFENVVFGCGHNNSGTFNPNEMGLIGFGRAPASFISQVGPSVGGRKFSYCLMPFHTDIKISTTITIGAGSEVHGRGVTTIPLALTPDRTSYSLTLTGITVGSTFLPYNSTGGPAPAANVILDSGTPPILLPQQFYDRVAAEMRRQIRLTPTARDFCYTDKGFVAPPVILNFAGGVDLALSTVQSFIKMDDGSFCFAIQGWSDSSGIIGNFAQANFLIGYDLEKMTVSFKPADCTKFG